MSKPSRNMNFTFRFIRSLPVLAWLVVVPASDAQWISQTNILKAGWNSVYLHVDASHTNANSILIGSPNIEEVWLWTFDLPPGLSLAAPPNPAPSSRWSRWTRVDGVNSVLQTLPGNAAMLVKVSSNAPPFNWIVKGRPVAPNNRWTLSGLNFVGLPTASPHPNFETFVASDAQPIDWRQSAEIFRYQGGALGATNPIQVSGPVQRATPVVREQAYWIRVGEPTNQVQNNYFGPFQITGGGSTPIRFGDSQGQKKLVLKNMTRSNLTVTLRELPSEAPPVGATPPLLPLMVRGPINTTNLTYNYSNLTSGPSQWTLTAHGEIGSEVEIVLGVDRSQMNAAAGTTYAGVLRFTDSLGLSRVDLGAAATTPSRAGLWVGNAVVDQVSQYLKPYAKATNVSHFHARLNALGLTTGATTNTFATSVDGHRYEWDASTGRILIFGGSENSKGNYLADGPVLLTPDKVARPFPLRLIVHNDGNVVKLLQRAYVGRDPSSNLVVATRQSSLLANDLANARRLSAVHLPTSDGNIPWPFSGVMQEGSTLTTTVDLGHNDHSSNPFLHTYHPDHDNRDALSVEYSSGGKESYDIRRSMQLNFTAPGNDFDSRTRGGSSLSGNYAETVSFRAANNTLKQFNVLGTFSLVRISDTATLVTQ